MPEQGATNYQAEQPTANEALVDSAVYHGLSLERVTSGTKQKIGELLKGAQQNITAKLEDGKLTDWQAKKAQDFLTWSNKVIANTYGDINDTVQADLDGIKKAEIQKQINSVNEAVGVEISPAMSTQQLESIAKADELLVNGAVMSDWWDKQAANLQHNVLTTVQGGLVEGKSTQDIAKELREAMGEESVTKAQANALVRTAAATVQSAAQKAYYDENSDIMKGIRWVSTLDDRTTEECMALDGLSWTMGEDGEGMDPVGHDFPWPGYPPIHWNCRSTTVPVLKSWQELSKVQLPHLDQKTLDEAFNEKLADQGFTEEEIANIKANQQASMDGQVPEAMTYEDWLKTKSEAVQKQILGPAKWQLWQDGKVSLMDMVKKDTLEPLTVDELQQLAEQNKAIPAPPPPVPGMHGLDLAERQILTAQMTSEAVSGETWASWYNPNNGVTIDQVLKHTINPAEDAQLKAQDKLVHLSNTASNSQLWTKNDAVLWSGQPGFTEAKLVTPSGRVIRAKLKAGKEWTAADAQKWALKMEEAADEGIDDPFRQMQYAFKETGDKMILTQTEPGAVKLDSSTMKKVYGPVHEEDKPLSYLEAHTNQQELQAQSETAAKLADVKAQLAKAEAASKVAAEESQLAREKQAALQTETANQRLEAAAKAQQEAEAAQKAYEAKLAEQKSLVEQEAARQAAALRAKQAADDALYAAQKAQEEADAVAAKIEKKKAAAKKAAETKAKNAAIKKAKAAAEAQAAQDAAASQQARTQAAIDAQKAAQDALWAAQQDKAAADQIYAQQAADKAKAEAQEKAIKAAKKAAKAKKTAAAPVNTHGQMQLAVEPKAELKSNFPADPMSLPVVKELGGYTKAQLVQDADGNLWVRKRGANADHIASEALFDHLYNIAGVDIPESKLYSTPQGPVKLARYIPDTTILGDYLKTVSPTEKAHILGVVRNQFVANALFANWDAVGANPAAGFDNILIGKNGKAYMIDTGGAGEFKGTGTILRGKFGPEVGELQTMLDPRVNPTTAPIFKGITDQQVVDQSVKIFQVRNELLAATPSPLKEKLAARLDWLDNHVTDLVADGKAKMPPVGMPAPKVLPTAPPTVELTLKGFPSDPMALKKVADYPVTNGNAEIVQDAAGNKYLRRTGGNPDALLDESRANDLMQKLGMLVPDHEMFTVEGKSVMLQKYVGGQTIDEFLATATKADTKKLRDILQKNFAIDALIGNTHVVDGVRITMDSKGKLQAYRVDNSGAFRYNVNGGIKSANQWENGHGVSELWTMRGKAAPHATTSPSQHTLDMFHDLNIIQVSKQLRELLPAEPPLTGDSALDDVLKKRWTGMRAIAKGTLDGDFHAIKTDWLEKQSASRGNWKQIGVSDRMAGVELKPAGPHGARLTPFPMYGPVDANVVLQDKHGRFGDDLVSTGQRAATPPPNAGALPTDKFYNTILTAVKSVNAKVGTSTPPTMPKLNAALAHKHELQLLEQHGSADEKKMASGYLDTLDMLAGIKTTGQITNSIGQFEQYVKSQVATGPVRAATPTVSITAQVHEEINRLMNNTRAANLISHWGADQAGSSQSTASIAMRAIWDGVREMPLDQKFMGNGGSGELTTKAAIAAKANTYAGMYGLTLTEAEQVLAHWHGFVQEVFSIMDVPNSDRNARAVRLVRTEPSPTRTLDGRRIQDVVPSSGSYTTLLRKGGMDSHSLVNWVQVYGVADTATAMPHVLVHSMYFIERSASSPIFFAGPNENEIGADGAGIPVTIFARRSTGEVAAQYSGPDATKWNLDISHLRVDNTPD